MHRAGAPVGDEKRDILFDEAKLRLIREFLRREFRLAEHRDYYDPEETAYVFVIETPGRQPHTLVVPARTFERGDLSLLCSTHLVDALRGSGAVRTWLTPDGVE
jgi:hypothetical protein